MITENPATDTRIAGASPTSGNTIPVPTSSRSTDLWQNKIFPYAIALIAVLLIFFVVLYWIETKNIQNSFLGNSNYDVIHVSAQLNSKASTFQDKLYNAELISLLNRHYHASLIVKSRILTLNLSFLTGMILCFMGGIFVLGKFSESASSLTASTGGQNLVLSSASPGIFLSVLGVLLISLSIFSKSSLEVNDRPTFLRLNSPATVPGEVTVDSTTRAATAFDTTGLGKLKKMTNDTP
jgi:hypothetical protein